MKKTTGKLLSVILSLAMLLNISPILPASAAGLDPDYDDDADGSALSPYIIDEPSDLTDLSEIVAGGNNYSGKYFLQICDLNMASISNYVLSAAAPQIFQAATTETASPSAI